MTLLTATAAEWCSPEESSKTTNSDGLLAHVIRLGWQDAANGFPRAPCRRPSSQDLSCDLQGRKPPQRLQRLEACAALGKSELRSRENLIVVVEASGKGVDPPELSTTGSCCAILLWLKRKPKAATYKTVTALIVFRTIAIQTECNLGSRIVGPQLQGWLQGNS